MVARYRRSGMIRWVRGLNPLVADALLAAGLISLDLAALVGPTGHREVVRPADALAVIILVLMSLPLVWRRQRPVPVLGVTMAAFMAYHLFEFPQSPPGLGPLVALYSVAAHCKPRTVAIAASVALPALTLFLALGVAFSDQLEPVDIVTNLILLGVIGTVGITLANRRARTAALEERAARLEQEREERARLAVIDERARIARELHDVVAHNVSVMVVQAGAARRVLPTRPGEAEEALVSIEATGRQALTEMRRLLGVLRTEDEAAGVLEPQPSLGQLEVLLASVREAGLAVDVTTEGEPRPLPAGVDLTAYRIVQEALTNILKHAGPARASVVLRYDDGAVEVGVSDDGRGIAADPAIVNGANGGHGLVGMRERVALFGGRLHAGPRRGGGYLVTARLPIDAPST